MGGPWRARGFDPRAWRPPTPRVVVPARSDDDTTRLVIAYVVALLASCGILMVLLARFA